MKIEEEMRYFLDRFLLGVMRRKRKVSYEPLKIIFTLSSPITLNHPWMHFDGLVSHLLFVDALGEDFFLLPRKFPFSRMLRGVDLPPFPIKETGGMYHSSVSIFDTDRKALEILYKRFEDRWAGGRKKIYRGSGFFRDYMIQHIYIPTRTVIFYVCGDYEVIGRLCSFVVGLGDNTRLGWGAVRSFEIEKQKEDWSIVKNGMAMRPIPEHLLEFSSEWVNVVWRPPYWAAENIGKCAPPGAKVEFKNECKKVFK